MNRLFEIALISVLSMGILLCSCSSEELSSDTESTTYELSISEPESTESLSNSSGYSISLIDFDESDEGNSDEQESSDLESSETSSVESQEIPAESSQESASVSESSQAESSGEESSESTISQEPDPIETVSFTDQTYDITHGYHFCLPVSWAIQPDGETILYAKSEDGLYYITAVRSTLPESFGLTEKLVAKSMASTLPSELKNTISKISARTAAVTIAGDSHTAVQITGIQNGSQVTILQIYVLDGTDLLTITISTSGSNRTQTYLQCIQPT